jgi:hypothetical protein
MSKEVVVVVFQELKNSKSGWAVSGPQTETAQYTNNNNNVNNIILQ